MFLLTFIIIYSCFLLVAITAGKAGAAAVRVQVKRATKISNIIFLLIVTRNADLPHQLSERAGGFA